MKFFSKEYFFSQSKNSRFSKNIGRKFLSVFLALLSFCNLSQPFAMDNSDTNIEAHEDVNSSSFIEDHTAELLLGIGVPVTAVALLLFNWLSSSSDNADGRGSMRGKTNPVFNYQQK